MSTRRSFVIGSMAAAAITMVEPEGLAAFDTAAAEKLFNRPELWFTKPAKRWMEAVPVGNGRIGGMVYGGVTTEYIDLTESTVWSGAPSKNNVRPDAYKYLEPIRQLMFAGKYAEARALCEQHILGKPESFGTHLPLGRLELTFDDAENVERYRRSLDLDRAVAKVTYNRGDIRYDRETFASNPDQVLVTHIACSRKGSINCRVRFVEPMLTGTVSGHGQDILVWKGRALEHLHSDGQQGVSFESRVMVDLRGGEVTCEDGALHIRGADALLLFVAIETDFRAPSQPCDQRLRSVSGKSFEQLRDAHVRDHQRLFRRVSLDLGGEAHRRTIPTDERRKNVAAGKDDPALAALFFQYGRYLTIAGSRANSPLPLALQGIWNDGLASSMGWTDDFHLDINTQQNYWLAEVANLSECQEPLFGFLEALSLAGRSTARDLYGSPGWVAHVVTNPWGYTAPGWGLGWGIFPTGGIWLALQMREHYRFTGDKTFLRERLYPVYKSAAEFFLAYMVKDPQRGWLVTGPSDSPENSFIAPDGTHCSESMGPTADRVLVYALLEACIEASKTLSIDSEFCDRAQAALQQLPQLQIGKHGQLQEWLEDFTEADPGHRHTSHLIALYPENQISPDQTPQLAAAARITIERRINQPNWEDSEWDRANLINYYARLLDPEAAHRNVNGLLAQATEVSLLTYSRGGVAGAESNIFALDGNTGGAAGIAEMLLQSQSGQIHLLPALPMAWPDGSVTGLCARGGVEVDMHWNKGKLRYAVFRSRNSGTHVVRYGTKAKEVHLQKATGTRVDLTTFSGD